MQCLQAEHGRIKITMQAISLGNDLCLIISGGDRPHLGCIALSIPRPSLSHAQNISATTSVLNLTGHKDDEAIKNIAHTVAAQLNKNVVATGGIHLDNITNEEIKLVKQLLGNLQEDLIKQYNLGINFSIN